MLTCETGKGYAAVYHQTQTCRGLRACKHEIKKVSLSDAVDMMRRVGQKEYGAAPACALSDYSFLTFLFAHTHTVSNVYHTFALFQDKKKKGRKRKKN